MEWRRERGPGFDLRQYWKGRPTGLVAATMWHGPDEDRPTALGISGHDVQLIIERTRITVVERTTPGHGGVRLRVPLRSCVDAQLENEPGLPGAALLRLDLTVRIGPDVTLTLPMWFPGEHGQELHRLVKRIRDRADAPVPLPPVPMTGVKQAPDSGDWVVFRPHRSSREVLRQWSSDQVGDVLTRPSGEAR